MSSYIYDTKYVSKGRTSKDCIVCGKYIDIGKSSITVTYFCDEFTNLHVCNNNCLSTLEEYVEKGISPYDIQEELETANDTFAENSEDEDED